jgi:hypothetical protein
MWTKVANRLRILSAQIPPVLLRRALQRLGIVFAQLWAWRKPEDERTAWFRAAKFGVFIHW